MKTPLLYHLKQIHNNPCINEDLGLQSSFIPKVTGLKFFSKSTNTLDPISEKNKMKFKNFIPWES